MNGNARVVAWDDTGNEIAGSGGVLVNFGSAGALGDRTSAQRADRQVGESLRLLAIMITWRAAALRRGKPISGARRPTSRRRSARWRSSSKTRTRRTRRTTRRASALRRTSSTDARSHVLKPGRARLLPSPNFSVDHGSAGASPYQRQERGQTITLHFFSVEEPGWGWDAPRFRMPRPLRVEYAGAIYHVMSRGDRKRVIAAGNDADGAPDCPAAPPGQLVKSQ